MAYREDNYYVERITRYRDRSAFALLVNKHKTAAFNLALRITHNREDAEEVSQDAFVKIWQVIETFERKSKFSTWMYRIVYNMALTKIRGRKIFIPLSDESDHEIFPAGTVIDSLEQLHKRERDEILKQAINQLEEADQLLITLYYLHEMTVDEIHEITDLSSSNVKVRLYRSRHKLRNILHNMLQDELMIMHR
jgi:RNA polymerase sigma factor (sigma-70 family)